MVPGCARGGIVEFQSEKIDKRYVLNCKECVGRGKLQPLQSENLSG